MLKTAICDDMDIELKRIPQLIFLLVMVMPMVSGLELGQSIRRISTDAQIIYITTDPGFALDAYAVNPLHYLLKPVDKTALFSALDLAAEKVNYGEEISITKPPPFRAVF